MKVAFIDRIRFGSFEFDRLNRLLYRDGAELALPPRAVGVLSCLIDRPGQIVSKQVLLDEVWKDANVTETSLTEAVSLLRQVLIDDPQRPTFIQTVPRRGYRFVAPLDRAPGEGDREDGAHQDAAARHQLGAAVDALSVPGIGRPDRSGGEASPRAATSVAVAAPDAEATWPAWLPWLFVAVTIAALAAILIPVVRQPSTYARPIVRFTVDLPAGLQLATGSDAGPAIALSRDGRRLAFAARRVDGSAAARVGDGASGPGGTNGASGTEGVSAPTRLYVRDTDRLEPVVLDGTDGATAPFFSPDAAWIGFFANGALKKVPAGGGPVITLCQARMPFGAVWTTRRFIVFASSLTGGLSRVPDDGGAPTALTAPDPNVGEVRHAWPDLLPDDSGVIFTGLPLVGAPEAARIAAMRFDDGRIHTLAEGGTSPHYAPTGHLLFARNRAIVAAPFDPEALEWLGPVVPVLDDVETDPATGAAQFAFAPGGHTAAVRVTRAEATATYRWVRIDGLESASTPFTLPFAAREIRGVSVSPDGRRFAFALGDGHRTDIWVSDVSGGRVQRLTSDGQNVAPIWTADSRRVIYASRGDGPFALVARTIDEAASSTVYSSGAAAARTAGASAAAARHHVPVSTSPEGLIYVDAQSGTGLDLWLLPASDGAASAADDGSARPLVQTAADETFGVLSPDGRWIAYQSNEGGSWHAMVRAREAGSDGAPAAVRVAATDGSHLAWTPDGRALLLTHDGRLLRVALTGTTGTTGTAPPQAAGAPQPLAADIEAAAGFGVTQDGRVLVRARESSATPPRLEVVLDWTRELSAKVPVRPRTPRPVR